MEHRFLYGGQQLTVKTLTGQSVLLDVEITDLVGAIKEKIASAISIPVDQQVVVFSGQCLEENQSLCFYEVLDKFEGHPFKIPTILMYEKRLLDAIDSNKEDEAVTLYFNEIAFVADYVNDEGYGFLDYAAHAGHFGIISTLIDRGCVSKGVGWKAPHFAACMGNVEVLAVLLSRTFDKDVRTATMDTILSIACVYDQVDVVKLLLSLRCNIDVRNEKNSTPLILVCEKGNYEICKLLVDAGCDINARNDNKSSLFLACTNGYLEIADVLLAAGCDMETMTEFGATPFLEACRTGNYEICRTLLAAGCNKEAKTLKEGNSALRFAYANGHDLNIDIRALREEERKFEFGELIGGFTPFLMACRNGHLEVCKLLVEAGCNKEAKDDVLGYTPLMVACSMGHIELVKYLLTVGCDIEAKELYEETSLSIACAGFETDFHYEFRNCEESPSLKFSTSHLEIIKVLLAAGCNMESKRRDGATPLIVACTHDNLDVCNLLLAAGCNKEAKRHDGYNVLMIGAWRGCNLELFKVLIDAGCDMEVKDACGETVLHKASAVGNLDAIKLLDECGADLFSKNSNGKTGFDLIPSRELICDEMRIYLSEAMDARRNHGFKRIRMADENSEDNDVEKEYGFSSR